MPIVKIRVHRQVTIPKKIFEKLGLHEGDFVEVKCDDKELGETRGLGNTDYGQSAGHTVLIEYFKSLRDEIHLRIRDHSRLVWIKILSLATIISFLIGRFQEIGNTAGGQSSDPLLHLAWVIPLIAAIFDNLIGGNLRVINNLGDYIKTELEEKAFAHIMGQSSIPRFRFWEEAGARLGDYWQCYTTWDMLAIWLFTFASWFVSILFRVQVGIIWIDFILGGVSFLIIIWTLYYLVRSTTVRRKKEGTA